MTRLQVKFLLIVLCNSSAIFCDQSFSLNAFSRFVGLAPRPNFFLVSMRLSTPLSEIFWFENDTCIDHFLICYMFVGWCVCIIIINIMLFTSVPHLDGWFIDPLLLDVFPSQCHECITYISWDQKGSLSYHGRLYGNKCPNFRKKSMK